ncbi:ABC transporter ATP-binding protein, partial [Umezawaea sp.]|uniref:ABC transporter ATP-binding protein n=1 Tax=Umezawaea sp. TaxID=1955258 RepID=UPI002ED4726F
EGQDVLKMSAAAQRSIRGRRVAMIFQDPRTALNPVYSIGDQLAEAVRSHEAVPKRVALARAAEMLDLVGIPRPKERLGNYPHEFSGGMRQRVMIAMAIINDPDVIVADEPTTALDVTVQAQILDTLLRIRDETNAGIIVITHDLGVVAGMVDRVQVMYGGTVVEQGGVDEVFEAQRMPYTVGLLGSIPNPSLLGKRLTPIKGAPPSLMNLPPGCAFSPRCPLAVDECREVEPELLETDRAGHFSRCHRSAHLATLVDPQKLFATDEIGVVENPASLLVADPDMPIVEDVDVVEARMQEEEENPTS